MIESLENKSTEKNRAEMLLEKLKEKERKTKMYEKRIDNRTVVRCNKKERLDEYNKIKTI